MLKALLRRMAGDITQLIKEDLLLVQDVIDLDSLDNDQKFSYLQDAHALWTNKVFQDLCHRVAKLQHEEILSKAQTEKQLWAGKCNLATASLFREEAKKLDAQYLAMKEPEPFDPHQII